MDTFARSMTRCTSVLVIAAAIALGASACGQGPAAPGDAPSPSAHETLKPTPPGTAADSGEAPTPKTTIEPVLVVSSVDTDGRNVSASGYVQGIVEDGKTCTFTFTGEGKTVRQVHEGSADRMTTSCGLVQVPIDQFVRGSWSVTLSYEAQGKTFASAPSTVEIP